MIPSQQPFFSGNTFISSRPTGLLEYYCFAFLSFQAKQVKITIFPKVIKFLRVFTINHRNTMKELRNHHSHIVSISNI